MLSRRVATLGALALGALTLVAASFPWVTGASSTAVDKRVHLVVTGIAAAPGVSAAAFVVVAGALALALAGRIGRWLTVGVLAATGIVTSASAIGVIAHPQRIALAAAADRTGLSSLDGPASLTSAPHLTVALGVLTVLWAFWVASGMRRWPASSRRHERAAGHDEDDLFGSCDALSRGEDPS